MQALHLEGRTFALRHLQDGRDGAGVVGGELGIDDGVVADQPLGAGQVGDVGVVLVGEHRIARQAAFLRALDLTVPVGAFHQAHHEAQLVGVGDARHLVHHRQRAGLVGLHGQTEALPLRPARGDVAGYRFKKVQRQFQSVAFLGIDGEIEVALRCLVDQRQHARQQLSEHALALGVFVAAEQRAELDRDAVGDPGRRGRSAPSDGRDRAAVAGQVGFSVALGARTLAQHVVAVAQLRMLTARAVGLGHGFLDGAAQHELPAQQLDGAYGGRHHRA